MRQYPIKTRTNGLKIEIWTTIKGKNGSFEGWFCFDTGSYTVVLPNKILKEIGAEKTTEITASGFAGNIKGDLYKISVECGGVEVEPVEAFSSEKEYYLIGMNFITRGEFGFFFDRQQLFLITEEKLNG